MTCLLDVNVLVALFWPTHTAHSAASRWFADLQRRKWATCPVTQAGFVRIVSNPAFSPHAVGVGEAVALLAANIRTPSHQFWPDDISYPSAIEPFLASLTGHRQVTDGYLLGLAIRHGGCVATLDAGMVSLARSAAVPRHAVELIGR